MSVSALTTVRASPAASGRTCWWGNDKWLGEEIEGRGKGPEEPWHLFRLNAHLLPPSPMKEAPARLHWR